MKRYISANRNIFYAKLSPFVLCRDYLESDTKVGLMINGELKGKIRPVYALGSHYPDDFLSEINMDNPNIKGYWIREQQHCLIFDVDMDTEGKSVESLTKSDLSGY